ncbi:hypothetical protein CCAND93_1410001 [Capnocytophaga canis]|uniref:Uncharacterized protein n=2 Tax=Capnocytophaga canis TaxID=1848903 RepID=A0A0B7IM91_9FLAO|nr:hypothetical protein CCAND93_1410001 [Capnocytophaga canis]
MHFFTGEKLKYLSAILNSNLFKWFMYLIIGDATGGNAGNSDNVKNLKIPICNTEEEKYIENLLNSENYRDIDKYLYKLYNLTQEEIDFIENV